MDVPCYFLTEYQYEVISMTLRSEIAKIMVKTAPGVYQNYVVKEIGKMVIFVFLDNLSDILLEWNEMTCIIK